MECIAITCMAITGMKMIWLQNIRFIIARIKEEIAKNSRSRSMSGSSGHVRTAEDRFRFTTGIVRTVGKVCLAQMPRQVLVLLAFSDDDRIRLEHS